MIILVNGREPLTTQGDIMIQAFFSFFEQIFNLFGGFGK